MSPVERKLKIFTGNANPQLAEEIAGYLGVTLGRSRVSRFSDGEIRVQIFQTVRGDDVFVVQPVCAPVNENLMELLIMIDAFKRASAGRLTAVIPYYGYARQDRKARPREPITAKLVANLLDVAGADRVLAVDLHAGQIQGFFDIPVDSLVARPILIEYCLERDLGGEGTVIVSPDVGSARRVRGFAEYLKSTIAIIDKRRPKPNVSEIMNIVGEVEGKNAVLVDDMIDTAGTICQATTALKEKGAEKIIACCTHPVLSGDAVDRLVDAPLEEVVVTNTIPLHREAPSSLFKVLSVAPLIGEAIERIYNNLSVSVLFN